MEMQHHSADLFDEFMMPEDHRRSTKEKQGSETGTADLRHFALYAFAGRTGERRWSRKNENIQSQPSDASVIIPQHNYKLDVHALNSRQPGQVRVMFTQQQIHTLEQVLCQCFHMLSITCFKYRVLWIVLRNIMSSSIYSLFSSYSRHGLNS